MRKKNNNKRKPRINLHEHSVMSALNNKDKHEIYPEDMFDIAISMFTDIIDCLKKW